jgi:hypothetical protein
VIDLANQLYCNACLQCHELVELHEIKSLYAGSNPSKLFTHYYYCEVSKRKLRAFYDETSKQWKSERP